MARVGSTGLPTYCFQYQQEGTPVAKKWSRNLPARNYYTGLSSSSWVFDFCLHATPIRNNRLHPCGFACFCKFMQGTQEHKMLCYVHRLLQRNMRHPTSNHFIATNTWLFIPFVIPRPSLLGAVHETPLCLSSAFGAGPGPSTGADQMRTTNDRSSKYLDFTILHSKNPWNLHPPKSREIQGLDMSRCFFGPYAFLPFGSEQDG